MRINMELTEIGIQTLNNASDAIRMTFFHSITLMIVKEQKSNFTP